MSYQTAISGLDWQMVPSGMIVPSGGIAAMQQYEQGMGAICAGNNVGYINANLTSGDYTGTIADIVYDTIMVTGNIATNRNIKLYYNAGTLNGVKRYFVILTPQASSGGPFTVTITTGTGKTVIVPIAASGDTLTSPDLQIEVTVDPSGNVRSASFTVSGSNAYGSWVKFADGTMECFGSVTYAESLASLSCSFPANFDAGIATCLLTVQNNTGNSDVYVWLGYLGLSSTGFTVLVRGAGWSGQSNTVRWYAFGRWRA